MIIVFGSTVFFLYDNFYNTLAQVRVVYILRNQVAFDMVDIDLWNKVTQKYIDKKIPFIKNEKTFTDPFKPLVKNVETNEE